MAQPIKQADVAKLAGVSRSTVSIVLNERSGSRVPISENTRQRVLDAAQKLGYHPNDLARNLRSGSSQTIGFLMPTLQNPHYWDILAGAEEIISARKYHISLAVANMDPEREHDCLRSLSRQRLDGLIVIPTFIDKITDGQEINWSSRPPAIVTQPVEDADWVFFDFRSGNEQVMDHLLSLGHRRIGLIASGSRQDLAQSRQTIYSAKLAEMGAPVDKRLLLRCGNLANDGYHAAQKLLALVPAPTAIWAINDLVAMGVMRAVYETGQRIPDDVALVGFDNLPLSEQLVPTLTTVDLPARQLGRRAAEILFRRLENPNAEPVQETIPIRLIIRASTGPASSPDLSRNTGLKTSAIWKEVVSPGIRNKLV